MQSTVTVFWRIQSPQYFSFRRIFIIMFLLKLAWKEIAGFRDIAAHKYQTLRMEDVYETAVTDFPDLQQKITRILAE